MRDEERQTGRQGGRREEGGKEGKRKDRQRGRVTHWAHSKPTLPPLPLEEEGVLAALMCKDLSPGTCIPSSVKRMWGADLGGLSPCPT